MSDDCLSGHLLGRRSLPLKAIQCHSRVESDSSLTHTWAEKSHYRIRRRFFICHIHNYTEYNQQWNLCSFNPSKCAHNWSSGQPTLRRNPRQGAFGGSVPCSRVSPQSWTIPAGVKPTTSGYKPLSIRPRLLLRLDQMMQNIWEHLSIIRDSVTFGWIITLNC